MRYSVAWLPQAEQDLSELWMAAPHKAQFAEVVDQLEIRLSQNPQAVGESRDSMNHRVAIEPPVGILFDLFPGDRLVQITHIGWLPPPRHT